jgi:hypothetical protein
MSKGLRSLSIHALWVYSVICILICMSIGAVSIKAQAQTENQREAQAPDAPAVTPHPAASATTPESPIPIEPPVLLPIAPSPPTPPSPQVPTSPAQPTSKTAQKPTGKPVKLIQKAKPSFPPRLRRSSYSMSPMSSARWRAYQNSLGIGIVSMQMSLNLPLSSYLISNATVRTVEGASETTSDFRTYSMSLYYFTPQIYNIGLIGSYVSAGTRASNIGRLGLYYRFLVRWNNNQHLMGYVPGLLTTDSTTRTRQFLNLWVVGFYQGLISLDGSANYAWSEKSRTITIDPAISIRLYEILRLMVLVNSSKVETISNGVTTTTSTYSNNIGLELKGSF